MLCRTECSTLFYEIKPVYREFFFTKVDHVHTLTVL